jgi:hypothetical protein
MADALRFLAGIPISTLPERYYRVLGGRAGGLVGPALVSGLTETAVCLALLIFRYLAFFPANVASGGQRIAERIGEEYVTAQFVQYGLGFSSTIEYVFHPMTVSFFYFAIEGVIRAVAAAATGEVVPTLPLGLVAIVHTQLQTRFAANAFGRRLPDTVEVSACGERLTVRSCRPKRHWNGYISIRYGGRLYKVAGELTGTRPRPFVWHLRKHPPGHLVRVVYAYSPDEVLDKRRAIETWKPV